METDQYTDGDKWADDIEAVIDELALDRPILVGWSYGGYIISDYIHRRGQDRISGINFVAAAVVLGPKAFGPLIGPGFLRMHRVPVRKTFRKTSRQFAGSCAPVSSSRFRRMNSRKSWHSI